MNFCMTDLIPASGEGTLPGAIVLGQRRASKQPCANVILQVSACAVSLVWSAEGSSW